MSSSTRSTGAVVVPRVLLVGSATNETNSKMAQAWSQLGLEVELVTAEEARATMRSQDVAIGRLDVLPTLDGVEPGLSELMLLEHGGFTVLNRARALLNCHDKLRTARLLAAAGVPLPMTIVVEPGALPDLAPPVVVKPRFGSWGADVERCETPEELDACLARVATRSWYRRHGALVQAYVPAAGTDLRVLVAAGVVVGAVQRVALPGEWRTNTALGGTRRHVSPPAEARAAALAAADAVGTDLVGVDLLPLGDGSYTVIELNGAVEFTLDYGLDGGDPFEDAAWALGLVPGHRGRTTSAPPRRGRARGRTVGAGS